MYASKFNTMSGIMKFIDDKAKEKALNTLNATGTILLPVMRWQS